MSKKSKLIAAATIAVLGLSSQAFARGVGLSGGFAGGHMASGFHSSAFVGAPPPVINMPAPVFNPSEPYTVPESRETPVSPASPGSVFGNG